VTETVDLRAAILGPTPSREQVLDRIEAEQIRFINLQFSDVMGLVKSVTVPASIFEHIIEGGQWIDGSSIAGFTRIAESDMYLIPDLSTFAPIPWETGAHATARVICWVFNPNGDPFPGDPRWVLYRQLERAASLGYLYKTGPELEFFLFSKDGDNISPLPHDRASYFDFSSDLASDVRKDMAIALDQMGIEVEASHHEVAIGQHEIDFEYGDALPTADRAVTSSSCSRRSPSGTICTRPSCPSRSRGSTAPACTSTRASQISRPARTRLSIQTTRTAFRPSPSR
jgi:glutamine synthetase